MGVRIRAGVYKYFSVPLIIISLFACSITLNRSAQDYGQYGYINAQGYRYARYRAPTPQTVPRGNTVTTEQLRQLVAQRNPVLIDVQAVTVRPELSEFGMDWLPSAPRESLPGAVWLPNVGYATLDPRIEDYFKYNLEKLTVGNKSTPIVIFCVVDCWLSWNAVQRAAGYGYDQLYWYRGGTDSWEINGYRLKQVDPEPLNKSVEATTRYN